MFMLLSRYRFIFSHVITYEHGKVKKMGDVCRNMLFFSAIRYLSSKFKAMKEFCCMFISLIIVIFAQEVQ